MVATKRGRQEEGFSVQERVSAALVSKSRMHCASVIELGMVSTISRESTGECANRMRSELDAESQEYTR